MESPKDPKTFNELSERYSTWVIKYRSTTYETPLFIVWYTDTDENRTDRLLTFKSGEIFASNSLADLKMKILATIDQLVVFDNLFSWLGLFDQLEVMEYCSYDLISVEKSIHDNYLEITVIEEFVNFINLFNDFVEQDKRNSHLHIYSNKDIISVTWEYFYNHIFWPRYTNKEKFEAQERTKLNIDAKELLINFKILINQFDRNIKL